MIPSWRVLIGDVRAQLGRLPEGYAQCCVTSPPYWGLRDYGCAGQLGLEPTPDAYVQNLVAVFREVRRVLKDDGTCWLNLGDCYGRGKRVNSPNDHKRDHHGVHYDLCEGAAYGHPAGSGANKQLTGIPWRVAFALQADGWYLRSDSIWSKPNPMPESVTDRPTKAHEYIFLLTKAARYYYDAGAIAEPVSAAMLTEVEQGYDGLGTKAYAAAGAQNPSSVKARIITNARARGGNMTRNKRSVWTITTQPYKEAHFATFPEKLVEPCIKAGSRPDSAVLDPFCGSGTTGAVACALGRHFLGIDLKAEYVELARARIGKACPTAIEIP